MTSTKGTILISEREDSVWRESCGIFCLSRTAPSRALSL
jgi:hypothetical protein